MKDSLFYFCPGLKKHPHTLLLSSAYLPPVEYFAYLQKYPQALIEQHETYPKQTYRNRCHIYTEKGKTTLSVPVSKVNGNRTKTNEVELFNEERWQMNHWRAIESAYIASPYFLFYKDELAACYSTRFHKLLEFNTRLTKQLCTLIGIDTEIGFTDEFHRKHEDVIDLRSAINPKKPSTIGHFPEYIQVFGDRHGFIPNLSIIDLLFNLGPGTKNYLAGIVDQD